MKIPYTRKSFEKYSKIKFHDNRSSGSRIVPCGQTGRRTDRDMTKLIATFRYFAKAPKNGTCLTVSL